ncbi:hypothetical protein BCR32DRAFT_298750 [Anaeromyces robustus]|uniref:Uncharacterized protein n=1 Tax=Anaeromyces robustus TaxID=1754192 RepID=A0A1Y1UL27_9FUNG|nr:hypothetical protein BCR32DRAFT_298750 [Anaeromyces robustus]|eukprot:ORX38760.1 hypothetical protein BCR32DRAFT_298750 [Anaeromyces robustus]
MQQNEMKLLEEIKELLTNNNNAQINTGKAMVAAEEVQDKEVKENDNANANAAPPPETSEESIIEQKNNENEEFEKLYQEISKNIDDYKSMVSKNENVTSDEQFTKAAMIRDKTKTIKQYINKLTSLAENDDQKNKVKEINDKYDNVESNHIEKVNNDQEIVKDEAAAKEAAKEDAENAESEKPKNVISINHAKKIISEIAASTTNEAQVDEVQRIIKEIQLNDQVEDAEKEAANVDEDEAVAKALNEVASNSMNDEQVEEVRKFIKSIEAKAIIDENLKKEEVIKKLIFDISANSTNEEQVHQIQRILEKIELYNKFTEEKQQEREDNLAFGHEMAEEIQKTPDEISNDLKNLLVNLVNQATTEEEAANVANIITQIKKHDELIKEKQAADTEQYVKVPNTEAYMIDLTDGTSNEVYLKEDQEIIDQPVAKNEVPVINLEEIDDTESHKGMYILGAFGVLALAGFGYSYRSKAKKLNDEFPFSDNNLPFSNSMNGLVVDKNFLLRKNSIPKPENIINNDAVIRPSQPSWATSILMDENNKKGLKDSIQMTEDPEQLLDEQLREIENKEKVIVNKAANTPSVVITIDENNATTEVTEESPKPKQKKATKKPKLRRSISVISLDKKAKEDKEESANTEKKRSKKEKKDKKQKKSRKTKSLIIEKVKEEPKELDEDVELSLNTSFILDAPSLLFNDEEIVEAKKNNSLLNTEKPNLPKRISSCTPETKEVLPTVQESEEILPVLTELENEDSECQFSQEFAKELMEDYNKKFGPVLSNLLEWSEEEECLSRHGDVNGIVTTYDIVLVSKLGIMRNDNAWCNDYLYSLFDSYQPYQMDHTNYTNKINYIRRGIRCHGIDISDTYVIFIRRIRSWTLPKFRNFLEKNFPEFNNTIVAVKHSSLLNDNLYQIKTTASEENINKFIDKSQAFLCSYQEKTLPL